MITLRRETQRSLTPEVDDYLEKAGGKIYSAEKPAGFSPIPNSPKGGYHMKRGAGYVYWYPGQGVVTEPHKDDKEAPKGKPLPGWKKTGGWPSKDPPFYTYEHNGKTARIKKVGKKFVLNYDGEDHEMPKKATVDHAMGKLLELSPLKAEGKGKPEKTEDKPTKKPAKKESALDRLDAAVDKLTKIKVRQKELADKQKKADIAKSLTPEVDAWLAKAAGPFIGPRGGKWADPQHTIPWTESKPKEPKSVKRALDLAKELGVPAEKSGARSISLGGKAAFDRNLGKWNYKKGSEARRTASATKAIKWLEAHREALAVGQSFKNEMESRRSGGLVLSGNTYPFKEQIKSAGGVWDRDKKAWLMPDAGALDTMQRLMGGLPKERKERPRLGMAPKPTPMSEEQQAADRERAIAGNVNVSRAILEARKRRDPSRKQISYAMSLIDRLRDADYGTLTTYGYQSATEASLSKMSAADVSSIIDHVRSELF